MKIEKESQLSIEVLDKGKQTVSTILNEKWKEGETIDIDEDIVILNWDISTLTLDQMNTKGELLKKRAK